MPYVANEVCSQGGVPSAMAMPAQQQTMPPAMPVATAYAGGAPMAPMGAMPVATAYTGGAPMAQAYSAQSGTPLAHALPRTAPSLYGARLAC